MLYKHNPKEPGVKYYADGYVKVVNGLVFVRDDKTYVYDFYHDDDYLVREDNEVSEEKALEEFVKLFGDANGFYTYTM